MATSVLAPIVAAPTNTPPNHQADLSFYDHGFVREVTCPICHGPSAKAIYMGIPVRLCQDDACNCVFGPLWRVFDLVPFNGYFMTYSGSYWRALWHWLTVTEDE